LRREPRYRQAEGASPSQPTDARMTRAVYGAAYRWRQVCGVEEQVSPLAAPDARLEVAALLP